MGQPTPKAITGARAIIKVNDQVMAFATSVSYVYETEYKEIQGVDNSLPEELAPTNIKVEVRCTNIRIPNESPTVSGIQANVYSHLEQSYVSIELKDRKTDAIILFIPKAMLVRREGTVASRGLASETWIFKGIGMWDEREPEQPPLL